MNKGFTLVELIAVITILGLLAIITTPAYDTISNSIKESNYKSKQNTIKKQTLSYVEKYLKNEVFDGNSGINKKMCFTVKYLIENGIVLSDDEEKDYIKNDVTKDEYEGNTIYLNITYDKEKMKLNAIAKGENDFDENCHIVY